MKIKRAVAKNVTAPLEIHKSLYVPAVGIPCHALLVFTENFFHHFFGYKQAHGQSEHTKHNTDNAHDKGGFANGGKLT